MNKKIITKVADTLENLRGETMGYNHDHCSPLFFGKIKDIPVLLRKHFFGNDLYLANHFYRDDAYCAVFEEDVYQGDVEDYIMDDSPNSLLSVPWKLGFCEAGEACWCRTVVPIVDIIKDSEKLEVIGSGRVEKEIAEYIVQLHNNNLK